MTKLYNRKQKVIEHAFELFTTKGYQSTSIQDILDKSGISKGTFYNYFSSKQEIFIASIIEIQNKLITDRDAYLIGKSSKDKSIFIEQMSLVINSMFDYNFAVLLQEVSLSKNDGQFLKKSLDGFYHEHTSWTIARLQDIFGEDIREFALDLTIQFMNITYGFFKFSTMVTDNKIENKDIIQFCFQQLEVLVQNAITNKKCLIPTSAYNQGIPCMDKAHEITELINKIKLNIQNTEVDEQAEQLELLDILLNEILQSHKARIAIIKSSLCYLHHHLQPEWEEDLAQLNEMIKKFPTTS